MFELLDSQRVYNQAIQGYNEARANYQISLHRLEHAVGVSLR
jgi:outer membrane protein TolC